MKKQILSLTYLLFSVLIFAQSPSLLSYQAVVRNDDGNLVGNKEIGISISIIKDSLTGQVAYTETQNPMTNENGLFSIEIGKETGFNQIDWSTGTFYLKTEIDPAGGANYSISAVSQLLSVPFSLYANKATELNSTTVRVLAQNEWINLFPVKVDWGVWTISARAHGFGFTEKYQEWRFIIGDNVENIYLQEVSNFGNSESTAELRLQDGYLQGRWTGIIGGGPFCAFKITYSSL